MSNPSIIQMQNRFLRILPRIRTHARIYHRHVRCRVKRADAIAETIGLAWKWFVRFVERGKHPEASSACWQRSPPRRCAADGASAGS